MRRICLGLAVLIILLGSFTGQARADLITYAESATLSLTGGPDNSGLNGAAVILGFEVSDNATYVLRFGFPAVPVSSPTLTITGSSVAVNNGVLSLEPSAFYPSYAGTFTEPGGLFITVTLPDGNVLVVRAFTVPTETGSAAVVGGTVAVSDFAPTTPADFALWSTNDSSYALKNGVVTASVIPEPASLSLLGIGALGMVGYRWSRRKLSV